jgi:5'-nucleotidase
MFCTDGLGQNHYSTGETHLSVNQHMKHSGDRIALIDLDGTVADYDKALNEALDPLYGPDERRYTGWDNIPDHIIQRRDLVKRQPGFWRKLPRIQLGFDVVAELEAVGFELHALTKGPVKTTGAWTEKVEWCQEHLPKANVTITQDKSLVYGRILFDDYPPYFEAWQKVRPRGLVICVAHPWNAQYDSDQGSFRYIVRYDGTNMWKVKERIIAAWNRKPGEDY